MITRVTENMKFNTITNNLFNAQGKSAELMEKLSTEKMINRPSDNPIGAGNVLNYRSTMASIDQYQTNITDAKTWLSLTNTNLSGIKDMIGQARDIAISQSSAVASPETMDANAAVLSSLIDDTLSLLNTKQGDSYLFGGSKTDVAPFSAIPSGRIGAVVVPVAPPNAFDGNVTSSGTYTGAVNKTYVVKIIAGGTLAAATYQISSDGGTTWGATQTDLSSPITLGDGIKMTFTPNTVNPAAGDSFTVNATAPAANIDAASAATANKFNGTVTSSGIYTGTEDKTFALKIIGGTLIDASYQISSDGGKTWGTTQTHANLSAVAGVTLGDGIKMNFAAGINDIAANDLFTVNAYPAGYYRGNNDNLTVQIGKGNNLVYNITGSSAFTAANGPVATTALTTGTGTTLTKNDTITLTRGATVGSWTLTNHAQYPGMVITSMSDKKVTIKTDATGTDVITLSLSGNWSTNDTASFSITGGTPGTVGSAVTVHGPGTVDLLTTLNTLKSALEAHDITAISAQIDDLNIAQTQVLEKQTEAGAKTNSLDLASSNLKALNEQITTMKSGIEDIDQAKIITSFQMQQIALQASYNLAAQIGKMTILDFLT